MKVVIAFRSRQRRTQTNFMCRTIGLPPTGTKLHLGSLFQFMMVTNKHCFKKGLQIPFMKRLEISVYRISYWSSLGPITIPYPYTGSVQRLPSFAKRANKQYFIKFHAHYRVSTRFPQVQRPFFRTSYVKMARGRKFF
jgi:hypothetical protein